MTKTKEKNQCRMKENFLWGALGVSEKEQPDRVSAGQSHFIPSCFQATEAMRSPPPCIQIGQQPPVAAL